MSEMAHRGEIATERKNGVLIATCLVCEEVRYAPDKGIGRANLAAWRTQHQHPEESA